VFSDEPDTVLPGLTSVFRLPGPQDIAGLDLSRGKAESLLGKYNEAMRDYNTAIAWLKRLGSLEINGNKWK